MVKQLLIAHISVLWSVLYKNEVNCLSLISRPNSDDVNVKVIDSNIFILNDYYQADFLSPKISRKYIKVKYNVIDSEIS